MVGAPGSGKSAFLHHVERGPTTAHLVRVRPLRCSRTAPYRDLGFLLPEYPEAGTPLHPALVSNVVLQRVRKDAGSRNVVLMIDDAEQLDALSSAVIGQLIQDRAVRALLTVTDPTRLDPSLLALWRSGSLDRTDLTALSFDQTWLLAEARLGAPLSREGVEALAEAAGGSPRTICSLMQDLVRRSVLTRRDDVWVLSGDVSQVGYDVDAVLAAGPALSAHQRDIVLLLALLGSAVWADLALLFDASDIDGLEAAGVLQVDSGRAPRVSLVSHALASVLADSVSAPDAERLYATLTDSAGALRDLRSDPARHVLWRLRAGRAVLPEQVGRVARALNDDGEYGRARALLALLGQARSSVTLTYYGLVAAVGLGHHEEASDLATALTAMEEQPERREMVDCRIECSRLQRLSSVPAAAAILEEETARITSWTLDAVVARDSTTVIELEQLQRRLRAARAELDAFEGRFRENLEALPLLVRLDPPETLGAEERRLQLTAQSLLLEARIATGQDGEGELARSLVRHVRYPGTSYRDADGALLRIELAYLFTGGRSDPGSWGPSPRATGWSWEHGSLAQLFEGLDLLARNRLPDAGAVLRPVVQQLRVTDPHGVLVVAAAALILCCEQEGSSQRMITRLPLADAGGSSWMVRGAARSYRAQSFSRRPSRSDIADKAHHAVADGPEPVRPDRERRAHLQEEPAGDTRLGALTNREREIALLASTGKANRDIARTVFLSVRTVEGHLYRVYSKIGISTRAELRAVLRPDDAR